MILEQEQIADGRFWQAILDVEMRDWRQWSLEHFPFWDVDFITGRMESSVGSGL